MNFGMESATGGLSECKLWQDRIFNGLRYQQKVGRGQEWARYKAYYRHEFAANTLPLNLVFSVLRSMTPQIILRNPKITCTPRKTGPLAELNCRIVQKIDNWLIRELMMKREIKRLVNDCFFAGTATGFTGYDSMFGLNSDMLDAKGEYTLSQFNRKGDRIEVNTGVMPGMPWFLRARPEDVIFPWGCTGIESADWIAMRIFRRVVDLQADKKYSNTKDLVGEIIPVRTYPEGGRLTDWKEATNFSPDPQARWVELWQVHDARSGKVLAFTMQNENTLLRKDNDDMQVNGLPAETLTFNPDPDYIYGIPDARIIEPQLLEMMDIRTQSMKHRQVNIIKSLIKKGALDAEQKQKLKSGDIGAFVEVETEMGLRDSVVPLNPGVGGILEELTGMGNVVQGDVREMVGFSRILQGEYQGKTHVTSAETQAVMASANIRLDERRDAIVDLLTRVISKFNAYIFKYWTRDRVESIVGPDGAQYWVKYSGKEIADEYDIIIEPEEGTNLDTTTKRQEYMEAAQAWAQMNQPMIEAGAPIPDEIQRVMFNQFDDLGLDIDKLLAQTRAGNQMAQQKMAMEALGGAASSPQTAMRPHQLAAVQQAKKPPMQGNLNVRNAMRPAPMVPQAGGG